MTNAKDKLQSRKSAWESLPKGWTRESLKEMWAGLTGNAKHKVTACMTKMEGHVDDPGAFCASLADEMEPGWRSRSAADRVAQKYLADRVAHRFLLASSLSTNLAVLTSLRKGDSVIVEARGLKPRTLQVTAVEASEGSHSVYLSSGRVRPGHVGGGYLVYNPKGYGEEVMYQPTPLQQIVEVTKLTKA